MNKQVDYKTRNRLIVHYYLSGWSFRSIGNLFGISRQRVFEILVKKNVKRPLTPIQKARKQWREKVTASFGRCPESYENI
jgi:predicted DNA-binding protein YlxM (UPF0122 family)